MVRIAGVDVPDRKRAHVALRRIYGIGPTFASEILVKAALDPVAPPRMNELSEEQVDRIREIVDRDYNIEGDLRREVNQNIRRLNRNWLLPGPPPPAGIAGPRPANPNQRPLSQGTPTDSRRPGTPHRREEVNAKAPRSPERPARSPSGKSVHLFHLQQHHRQHYGPSGQRDRLRQRRHGGFQRIPKGDGVRRPAGRGAGRPSRHGYGPAPDRCADQRPRLRAGGGDTLVAERRTSYKQYSGRNPHPAQRGAAPQTQESLGTVTYGQIHRTILSALPKGRRKAVLKGRPLLHTPLRRGAPA